MFKKEELKTNVSKETEVSSQKELKISSSTFKGELSEVPIIDEDTVILAFEKIIAIKDEDNLLDSLNANGVVLLADMTIFDKEMKPEDFKVGSLIEFELETPTAMTYSIPPQVAGNSIKRVSLAK
ncbi:MULTISPECIES: hypothetical protein [Vagococcus]|uniref:Uncharacterized protein n=1 Tax=Vagococcus fluvialis bH819 TaxID=1255619 RepID=A0A1X6WQX1_9ENTE|nr:MULTISPECIES: hypothetical protein [Vagococcus]SLM86751.1 hypothetical protein FM121_11690 [Vagococcus fluvialis bH819]HCM88789.1 hypothetical protein [Vagococcus sp.]